MDIIKQNISDIKNYIKIGDITNAIKSLNIVLSIQANNSYAKKTIKKIEKKHDLKITISSSPPELINELVKTLKVLTY